VFWDTTLYFILLATLIAIFEIFVAVLLKIQVLLFIAPCMLVMKVQVLHILTKRYESSYVTTLKCKRFRHMYTTDQSGRRAEPQEVCEGRLFTP
jgi:hypothetical protein